jgi:hypothetical protein
VFVGAIFDKELSWIHPSSMSSPLNCPEGRFYFYLPIDTKHVLASKGSLQRMKYHLYCLCY